MSAKKSSGAIPELSVMQFQPTIAANKEIGLNGAIIIQQVHYWTEQNRKKKRGFYDGRYWVYNSVEEWKKNNFPFMSRSTIDRTIARLENLGVLLSATHNRKKYDRTKSYAIDYKRLYEITGIEYQAVEADSE